MHLEGYATRTHHHRPNGEQEEVMASFGSYVLLCLILAVPFTPLVVQIVADYLNDRSKNRWAGKVT
jgi:hypothetical protein